jgi:hypothetical protein
MAHVLEQVPVSRITREAREVRFGRTVLAVIAGLLYGIGWMTAKLFSVVWFAVAWAGTAVKIGWVDARGRGDRGDS